MRYRLLLILLFLILMPIVSSSAYITAHTNATIPVAVSGIWHNITFNQEPAEIQERINHTYNDSTNTTFTIIDDGIYEISYTTTFQDSAVVPTSHVVVRIIKNNAELNGLTQEEDLGIKDQDKTISHSDLISLSTGDTINLQFTSDDTTVSLTGHLTYGEHLNTGHITIKKLYDIAGAAVPIAANFTFKRFECDVSTTGKAFALVLIILSVVVIWMFSFWLKIPVFSIIVGLVVCYFAWIVAACFFLANVLFIVMGLISIMFGITQAFKKEKVM